jgi:alpha-D-ribose 1-methylphosphonate 5-triphosphate synthase subunit PhnL
VRCRGRAIGFVFQVFNLLPALTGAENVAVPLLLAGRPRNAALETAGRLLASVELDERKHALPGQLSGGQQQRVAIARACIILQLLKARRERYTSPSNFLRMPRKRCYLSFGCTIRKYLLNSSNKCITH